MKKYTLDLVGCDHAKEYFISALNGGYLSHAYIIEGASGSGRHTLIKELLKAMACECDNAPCGECGCCVRLEAGVCVDVHVIKAAEGKTELTVDLIRGIYDSVGLMPADIPFKAYIIEDGDKMNRSAQNAFLKLFEEPPENVYFFIITTDAQALLPTIRSRALIIRTERLDREQMKVVLDKKGIPDNKKREDAIALSNGCAGEAMRIYEDGADAVKLRDAADKLIKALLSPGSDKLSFINVHQKNIKKTDELCRVYALLQTALRDVIAVKIGATEQTVYFTNYEDAEEYSLHISDRAVIKTNDVISELLSISDVPLNPTLAITEFASRVWDAHLI